MLTSTSIGFRLLAISCLVTLSALVELDTYLGTLQYCQSQSCNNMVQIGFLISEESIITNNTPEGGLKELVTTTIVRLVNCHSSH
jgi:hypothetical protein